MQNSLNQPNKRNEIKNNKLENDIEIYDESDALIEEPPSLKKIQEVSNIEYEEKEKSKEFWFVSHLAFEEYESKQNRLILSLRKWSLKQPKAITVYINHPLIISTEVYYSYDYFVNYLRKLKNKYDLNREIQGSQIIIHISKSARENKDQLEKEFPNFNFVIDDINSFVVNARVRCDKKILDQFEKLGFQTKGINKSIRRQLEWMYKKTIVTKDLEYLFDKTNEINELYSTLSDKIADFYGKSRKHHDSKIAAKITRLTNEIRRFYLSSNKLSDFAGTNSQELKKEYPSFYKLFLSNNSFINEIDKIGTEIAMKSFSLRMLAKSLDESNSFIFNEDTNQFEIVLNSKNDSDPYSVGGTEPIGMIITDERIPYPCWKSLSTCYIDIEKPMWKTEEEKKIMQEISELQAELTNKNSTRDPLEIKEKIQELTKKMIVSTSNKEEVNLLEERYKEQISRVMIHLRKEDGTFIRYYFKLRNPSSKEEIKSVNGFTVFYFDTEYELLNAVVKFLKKEKPYRIVGHVIPYDLSEIRDSARENKSERFDLGVKKKEPRLWRRQFYQKISMAAQEIIDTHRLSAVWFPYLKLKAFDLSHKLADVSNFVYLQKKRMGYPTVMQQEFHKIATHEQLKELEIRALNGDREAEYKLDFYSTHDIDPLIEIFDFEPTMKLLYKAAAMVPHIPITDVAFTPSSMNEIFHLREWKVRHTQLHYGYKEKMREDERQIFKKRLNEYMRRQLSDEGIPQIRPGVYQNVYLTYIPLELMLSNTFFPSQPQWNHYFSTLHSDPIIKIAELQYPKYFMRQNIHVDYYLYRKEKDILREIARVLNISYEDEMDLIQKSYIAIRRADGTIYKETMPRIILDQKSLIRRYYSAYKSVKDKFRSFYISMKVKDKSAGRRIKDYIRKESTRREDNQLSFGFVNFFEIENSDLIKLYNLPKELEEKLEDKSKEALSNFRDRFDNLKEIERQIVSILSHSSCKEITDKVSPENMIFIINQFILSNHRRDVFSALYHIPPEGVTSFRTLIDNAYKLIGDWIRNKKLIAVGAKGDYLFISERNGGDIDFSDSPLIPIRKFERIDLTPTKEEDEEL